VRVWCTYRVQLHGDFSFADAARIADYLGPLGVTHLYCSPYLQAAPGSRHGYDVTDPGRISEELGGLAGHAAMVGALRADGLGHILDIVPNHMAVDPTNRWWWDVLENGPASRYASMFDIDWEGPENRFPFTVLVPILGDHYGRELDAGAITLGRVGGQFRIRYADHELPVSPRTLDELLASAARHAGEAALARISEELGGLPPARMVDAAAVRERHERAVALTGELEQLCATDGSVASAVDDEVAALNVDPARFDALLRRQNYRLAYWRTASEELDYRRFFNIESLVGVRTEDPSTFELTHGLILELVREGTVDGLRVDHVDGLVDPDGYLTQLADAAGGAYTVVEKILGPGEWLPDRWPVAGTTGYDFLTRVNNLFVAGANEQAMTEAYEAATGETASWHDIVQEAKQQVMADELSVEVERLTGLLAELTERYRRHRDHTRRDLRDALRELVARFEVYRSYVRPGATASEVDRSQVMIAVSATTQARPDLDPELVGFLGELACGDHPGALEAEFGQRLPQLTAPVMAKGVEDTAFYRYHRLVSLNEVGGDPGVFGRPPEVFHAQTATAAERWPESMITLSTHDTKRSADVRARLNVLSELPGAWCGEVERWTEMTEHDRPGRMPDRNTQYLLFQTLVGAWPICADRLAAFMAKAAREAKVHTSWTRPAPAYEAELDAFTRSVVSNERVTASIERFLVANRLVERARRSSLAQTALLLTCPGVPDLYQGSELWDLSLVDPDNRRPVDYEQRRAALRTVSSDPGDLGLGNPDDIGRPKLWLTHRLLSHRRAQPERYASTDYEPLILQGPRADDALAFRRGSLVVVVPRLGWGDWSTTTVGLPVGPWVDVLSGAPVEGGRHPLARLFARFPVAVLSGLRP
jgi:(1->4)-alpha-D-glucan 1-alpha-D-glucosylmutase